MGWRELCAAVAVPSFEARFNLSMTFGGYVEVLYAERPHEEQYTPCTPRCHDDPNCPPHLDCKPLLEPPTNGLRVRLDATQLPHAVQITLNQQTVLRRALDVTLTSGTQLTAVLLAVYDGALHLTHGGRKLADGIMLLTGRTPSTPRGDLASLASPPPLRMAPRAAHSPSQGCTCSTTSIFATPRTTGALAPLLSSSP